MGTSTAESLNEYLDIFTKEDYPPGEDNVSRVPFDDVFSELTGRFGQEGFSYRVTNSGRCVGRNGEEENYVIIELTVPFGSSGYITRPGAAQGSIGMSGLITMALGNATLRHLGMGSNLYQHEEGEEPNFDRGQEIYKTAQSPTPQRQVYGNRNYTNTPSTNGTPRYREWDGNLVIKSGQYENTRWGDVDLNGLQNMCNRGNTMAIKEMERRQKAGQVPRSAFN